MDIMTLVILAIVIVAAVGIGFVLVPYLKRKGIINNSNVETTSQLFDLIGLVISTLKIEDVKKQDTINIVFGVTKKVVDYVEQTMKYEDNASKKEAAIQTVKDILTKANIDINEEMLRLIEVGIESAVNILPKTYKEGE